MLISKKNNIRVYSIEKTRHRFSNRVPFEMMDPVCRYFVLYTKNNKYTNKCSRVGDKLITTIPKGYERCNAKIINKNINECKYIINELYTKSLKFNTLDCFKNNKEIDFYTNWFKKLNRLYYRRFKNYNIYKDINYNSKNIMQQTIFWPTLFLPHTFFYNGKNFKVDIIHFHICFKDYLNKFYSVLSTEMGNKYSYNDTAKFTKEYSHYLKNVEYPDLLVL